tara:strand:+ start:707 stop:1858 length:1152 start_codon:yes stop_codon:yes gene_type:complete
MGELITNLGSVGRFINIQASKSHTDGSTYTLRDEDKNQIYNPGVRSFSDVGFVMGIKNTMTEYDYGQEFIVGSNNSLAGGYYQETKANLVFGDSNTLNQKCQYGTVIGVSNTARQMPTGSIIVGRSNTVSGAATSYAIFGTGNTATTSSNGTPNHVLIFGKSNTMATSGAMLGGSGNTAGRAALNSIVMGANNEVGTSGPDFVSILGGQNNKMTNDTPYSMCYGQYASGNIKGSFEFASGRHTTGGGAGIQGSIQLSQFLLAAVTTDATPVKLSSKVDGSSTRPPIVADQSVMFTAEIIARREGATESAAYHVTGAIKNDAGTTALVGTPTVTVVGEDDANWDVSVAANNTDDTLDISCTGAAAKRVHWVGTVRFTQTIAASS